MVCSIFLELSSSQIPACRTSKVSHASIVFKVQAHTLFVWDVSHRVIILIRRLGEVEGNLEFGGRQESGTDSVAPTIG